MLLASPSRLPDCYGQLNPQIPYAPVKTSDLSPQQISPWRKQVMECKGGHVGPPSVLLCSPNGLPEEVSSSPSSLFDCWKARFQRASDILQKALQVTHPCVNTESVALADSQLPGLRLPTCPVKGLVLRTLSFAILQLTSGCSGTRASKIRAK